MPKVASFETFEQELSRLVGAFERGLGEFKSSGYVEAQLRDDFLNPFWRALGWDLENSAGLVQTKREVEIESRTEIGGRQTRADYLFRTDGHDQFVCEAKKPAEELHARYACRTACRRQECSGCGLVRRLRRAAGAGCATDARAAAEDDRGGTTSSGKIGNT